MPKKQNKKVSTYKVYNDWFGWAWFMTFCIATAVVDFIKETQWFTDHTSLAISIFSILWFFVGWLGAHWEHHIRKLKGK